MQRLVVLDGVEPPTRALSRRCSNHLSYSTMALGEGIEPSTQRLTVSRSTAELPQNCRRMESNHRPFPYKGSVLPTELLRRAHLEHLRAASGLNVMSRHSLL